MRLVMSADLNETLHTVKLFSLAELVQAHASLDALDSMRALQRARQEAANNHNNAVGPR